MALIDGRSRRPCPAFPLDSFRFDRGRRLRFQPLPAESSRPPTRCPWRGSFSDGPFPNGTGQFPGIPLSSDHFRVVVALRPA